MNFKRSPPAGAKTNPSSFQGINLVRASANRRPALVQLSMLGLAASLPFLAAAGQLSSPDPLAQPARAWAVEAANNEISIVDYNGVYLRYRIHMVGARGDQVRDVIESKDGTVARLISKDHRPLTPEEDTAEHERLQAMLDSPSAFAKHIKSDLSGKKLAIELVKLMPDAMLYDYAPGQPQRPRSEAHAGDPPEVVLDFKPNPEWKPPTISSEVLTGVHGRIWIDPRTHHLTRLEGSVFRSVSVGFGVIARVNPGGQFALEQVGVSLPNSAQRWIFSHFVEHISLRALMVKNFNENSQIDSSDFTQINSIPYQEAIRILLATPLPH